MQYEWHGARVAAVSVRVILQPAGTRNTPL